MFIICRCDSRRWASVGSPETLHVKTHARFWIWHTVCHTGKFDAAGNSGRGGCSEWQEGR